MSDIKYSSKEKASFYMKKQDEAKELQDNCNCDEKTAKSNNIHVCSKCLPK